MLDGWLGVAVATVFVLATALCAVSLAVHGARRHRAVAAAEVNHLVMGVAMVLMATAATAGLVPSAVGVVVFGVAAFAWFALLVVAPVRGVGFGSVIGRERCTGHPLHLLALDLAMVVMYLAMASGAHDMAGMDPGMPGMAAPAPGPQFAVEVPSTLVVVSVVLALYLVGHAIATVAAVVRRSRREIPDDVEVGPATGAILMVRRSDAPATTSPRPLAVLAGAPAQLIGQTGMSLAMAALLVL